MKEDLYSDSGVFDTYQCYSANWRDHLKFKLDGESQREGMDERERELHSYLNHSDFTVRNEVALPPFHVNKYPVSHFKMCFYCPIYVLTFI